MIISNLSFLKFKAPLICPFRTTLGQHDCLENFLVRLELDHKVQGWGEIAIASHITGETMEKTRCNLKFAWSQFVDKTFKDEKCFVRDVRERFPKNPALCAGLEMALLDALARLRGIPLWRLFGTSPVKVRTDITMVISSLRETQAAAKKFYARGFRQFKIKIGRDWDLDFQRVLSVRKTAPRSRILLDANQGYTAEQTIRFLTKLAQHNVYPAMIEQPTPKEDLDGLAKIRRAGLARVCADESVKSSADARRVIARKAADIINIKLMKSGFGESQEIIRLAQAKGLGLMLGGMMESALSMTAGAHFAAGLCCFDFIDLDTPFFIKGEWGRSPYLNSRGVYDVSPVRSGIGVRVSL